MVSFGDMMNTGIDAVPNCDRSDGIGAHAPLGLSVTGSMASTVCIACSGPSPPIRKMRPPLYAHPNAERDVVSALRCSVHLFAPGLRTSIDVSWLKSLMPPMQ